MIRLFRKDYCLYNNTHRKGFDNYQTLFLYINFVKIVVMVDILSNLNILYEDEDFLVLEKPVGLLVHPTKYHKGQTLVDWLVKHYPYIKDVGNKYRPGIVHRLDKDVSGLMIVAKTSEMYSFLVSQFKKGNIKKEYIALVHGRTPETHGSIDLPIGRTKKGKLIGVKYTKGIRVEKQAFTQYEVIKSFKQFTLLKVKPLTGRTHQIRIHLKSIGCSIVGDKRYTKIRDNLDRIFLHASYIGFYDLKNHWREFKSDLSKELKQFLNKIGD